MDLFEEMMDAQWHLQRKINGYDIDAQSLTQRIENIKLNVLAATAELHEALAEIGWKPWATSQHINDEQFKNELIDAWHFLMNLFLHAGMSAQDVRDRYFVKWHVNIKRQEDDYDGVSSKCSQCRRSLDDPANINEVKTNIPRTHIILYCVCGHELGRRDLRPDEV